MKTCLKVNILHQNVSIILICPHFTGWKYRTIIKGGIRTDFVLTRPHTVELLQWAEEAQEHGLDLGGGHQQQCPDTNPPHAEAGLRLLCV